MSERTSTAARVAVHPAGELQARRLLFDALEAAYPVCFEAYAEGHADALGGVVVIGAELPPGVAPQTPVLRAQGEECLGAPRPLTLSGSLALPLRGARLSDGFAAGLELSTDAPLRVLAADDRGPVWIEERPGRLVVGSAPAELEPGEPLRSRLVPGRCLALLALVHVIKGLLGEREPDSGALRAAFVFDDPNLHWPTYGHVHYGRLAAHGREHGYHTVIAMVPLDGWLAHPAVTRTFSEHPGQLSICVHGNDHLGPELGRVADGPAGVALAARAIRRSRAFELRTGLSVDPVMVPPHEALSEQAARGLIAAGYDAVCVSRPYPWAEPGPFAAPAGRGALSGWGSREVLDGGLPVLLRAGFNAPLEDLVLRAFLGQPLILYGHHDILADGPEPLARAASAINTLGDVRWGSLASVARAGLRTRRVGERLEVEMLSRRALLEVPEGVGEIRLDHRALGPSADASALVCTGGGVALSHAGDDGVAMLRVNRCGPVELRFAMPAADLVADSARTPIPALIRRFATEARDRLSVIGRGRGGWDAPPRTRGS